jgi:LacI family transcriptional regulator
MTTIHDIAKLAGVSTGTVSNVINNSAKVSPKTIQRVRQAIKDLDYIPNIFAKSLKTSTSRIIGILAEDVCFFSSGVIIDGICEYCENHDYSVNLCNLSLNRKVRKTPAFMYKELDDSPSFQQSVKSNLNLLLTSRVCGLIYIGTHPRDVGHILPSLPIPIIYTYAYTNKGDYCINYDDYQGARLAVDYLANKGITRIALICGSVDSAPSHKRMMGYQSALMDHNLTFYPEYIKSGNWLYEDGYNNCLELLALPSPPTGIFAMNDMMAVGALHALAKQGVKVPEDIALHGFDNLQMTSYTTPALSTIALPLQEMGIQAAKTMDDIVNHNLPDEPSVFLPCTHIIRESV